MKRWFTFLFFISAGLLEAQPYQQIFSSGVSTYYNQSEKAYHCLRFDTVTALEGGDTMFTSYKTYRMVTSVCLTDSGGSLLGPKVIKHPNGLFCFLNKYGDTVQIKASAGLNETWRFCNLVSGYYIEARIYNILLDSVLGSTDSVKVISFQGKNSSGENISSWMNNIQLKLSKNYGFTVLTDMYRVPDNSTISILVGKSEPLMGKPFLTWQEVYNYDEGDIFHYYYFNQGYFLQTHSSNETWEIVTILSKTVYPITNNYHYLAKRCRKNKHVVNYANGSNSTSYLSSSDTLWLDYSDETPFEENCNIELTDQQIGSTTLTWTFINNMGRTAGFYDGNYYSWNVQAECMGKHNPFIPEMYHHCRYAAGLGKIIDEIPKVNELFIGIIDGPKANLVYFKKGSREWGSKVANDCDNLLGNDELMVPDQNELSIIPNPVAGIAEVDFGEKVMKGLLMVSIYNLQGSLIRNFTISQNPFTISRDGLQPGIYFMVIKSEDKIRYSKIVFL